MLGQRGTRVISTTVWRGPGRERLDVENPNPGVRPGQLHYHDSKGRKYLYDPFSATFLRAPKSVNSILTRADMRKAIKIALIILGESSA